MSKVKDQNLYDSIKTKLYNEMPKHSAYRSGILVKRYKQAYFKKYKNKNAYIGKKTKKGLSRWFKEDWRTEKGKKTYKEGGTIFRPTKRITKDTPKTMGELTSKQKQKAILEKRKSGRVKKY